MRSKDYFSEHSIWSFLGILLGWGCALLLVPEYEYSPVGALIPSGIALSMGLLLAVFVSVGRYPDTLFRFENLLMLGLVYWVVLDAAQGAYHFWGISYSAIIKSYSLIALFALSIWVGSLVAASGRFKFRGTQLIEIDANFLYWATLVCFLAGISRVSISCGFSPACVADGLFAPRFESPWQLSDIQGWNTVLANAQKLGILVFPLTVALHHLERRVSWRVVLCLVFALFVLLVLIQDGGRRQVGMVLGASVIVWVLLNRPVRWRNLLIIAVISLAVLYLMNMMVTWRTEGITKAFDEDEAVQVFTPHEPLIRVDRNLRYMGYVVDIVPDKHPHTGWRGVYSIIASPVPRSVLPNKPGLHAFPLRHYAPHLPKSPTWSWTCSAVCDFYLIGGYLSVILGGVLFGMVAYLGNGLLSTRMTVRTALYYGLLAMIMFIGLRAVREVVILSMGVLALSGLFYLRQILLKRWRLLLDARL